MKVLRYFVKLSQRTAFKITRVGQLVAQEASRRLGVPFGIIDLSLAPTPAIGDSVAEILQEIGLEHPGALEPQLLLLCLNDQVKTRWSNGFIVCWRTKWSIYSCQ